MARRTGWNSKKKSYRDRLIGAGKSGKLSGTPMDAAQTRAYWESGGDLRGGRSHRPTPKGAAPQLATDKAATGLPDSDDMAALRRWRATGPDWIPRDRFDMGDDTAAVLSQIDIHPRRWRHVEVVLVPGGQAIMTVTPVRGYDRTVLLPDWESWQETSRLIRNPLNLGETKAEKERLAREWKNAHFTVNVTGTDTARTKRSGLNGPSPTRGAPRRRSTNRSKRR